MKLGVKGQFETVHGISTKRQRRRAFHGKFIKGGAAPALWEE